MGMGRGLGGALLCASLGLWAPGAWADDRARDIETGQDFTKPLRRVDLRLKHQLSADEDYEDTVATVRTDGFWEVGSGWQAAFRLDVPYGWSDKPDAAHEDGVAEHGLGDVLAQALLIAPVGGKWAYAVGAQMLFPTAQEDQMGRGKVQLLPTVGAKLDLGNWARGAWCAALVRHAFDVATENHDQPYVSETYVQPFLHVKLPRLWFLLFAPELRYDWRTETWFVPFDVMVGKMLTANVVASVEYKNAIVDDLPLYSQEVEGRIGFLF